MAGAAFVVVAILFQIFWLGLPAIFLSVALLASYWLWLSSDWQEAPQLPWAFAVSIIIFLSHAAEEFMTGFHRALPALFDRAAWSNTQFLVFIIVWMLVFCISAFSIRPNRPLPSLIVLFFAVAGGVGNGVMHLLLVVQQGGYFPGAWTAPLCLGVGIWLLRLLYGQVRPDSATVDPQHPA